MQRWAKYNHITLGCYPDALANTAVLRLSEFKPQHLSNTAWSFAKMNHKAPSLFDVIASAAKERIDDFNPQALSNAAWSFATLNHEAPSLFDAIATAAQERIGDFNPQALANTAWAIRQDESQGTSSV